MSRRALQMLLGRNMAQARQALLKTLEDRIEVAPIERDGRRGVRLTGRASVTELLTGEALPRMMVSPA